MRKTLLANIVLSTLFTGSYALAAAITPGNLVISRVGDGSAALSSAASAVFLDEYTTSGVSVGNTLALPTAASSGNFTLTLGGTSTSQGQLTLSTDKRFLTISGYDAPVGTTGPASNGGFQGRTIARVPVATGVVDTTTRFVAAGTTPRSVISDNGSNLWIASDIGSASGGMRYTTYGSSSNGTQLNSNTTNIRTVNIFNGQLYGSASTGVGGDYRGVFSVGTGLPTTASTFALLTGMGGSNAGNTDSTYDFYFSDANTVYVTDDDTTSPASGGVAKWTFNSGTSSWSRQWLINSTGATGARSITGVRLADGSVQLYAISSNTTTDLISILDTGSGTPSASILASAPANTVFRGVEFVPEPATLGLVCGAGVTLLRRRRA